jgi:hypothetical protein
MKTENKLFEEPNWIHNFIWILILTWIAVFNLIMIIAIYCIIHFRVELWNCITTDLKNFI